MPLTDQNHVVPVNTHATTPSTMAPALPFNGGRNLFGRDSESADNHLVPLSRENPSLLPPLADWPVTLAGASAEEEEDEGGRREDQGVVLALFHDEARWPGSTSANNEPALTTIPGLLGQGPSPAHAGESRRQHTRREPVLADFDGNVPAHKAAWNQWRESRNSNNRAVKRSRQAQRQARQARQAQRQAREQENAALEQQLWGMRQEVAFFVRAVASPAELTSEEWETLYRACRGM